jgi:hypothetical protein
MRAAKIAVHTDAFVRAEASIREVEAGVPVLLDETVVARAGEHRDDTHVQCHFAANGSGLRVAAAGSCEMFWGMNVLVQMFWGMSLEDVLPNVRNETRHVFSCGVDVTDTR